MSITTRSLRAKVNDDINGVVFIETAPTCCVCHGSKRISKAVMYDIDTHTHTQNGLRQIVYAISTELCQRTTQH